jgi:hypothetical protein
MLLPTHVGMYSTWKKQSIAPLCYNWVKGVPSERALCDMRQSHDVECVSRIIPAASRIFLAFVTEASLKKAKLTLTDMDLH